MERVFVVKLVSFHRLTASYILLQTITESISDYSIISPHYKVKKNSFFLLLIQLILDEEPKCLEPQKEYKYIFARTQYNPFRVARFLAKHTEIL